MVGLGHGKKGPGAMDALPYRATIFLRPVGLHCGQIDLMERSFAREADAVFWCKVMSEAEPHATGVWLVAESKGGRMLTVTREENFALASGVAGTPAETREALGALLHGQPSGHAAGEAVKMRLVGSA